MDKTHLKDMRTVPLSVTQAVNLALQRRVSLLIYHRTGVEAVPLTPDEPVVVGREAPARVRIDHPSLSRQHARFEFGEQGAYVEDLGSTNGTRVNGRQVERSLVKPGDEVLLGSVRVSLHTLAPAAEPMQGLFGHDRFLALLADEVVRHRTFRRKLGLLLVRAARSSEGHLSSWCPRVRQLLRPVDRVALYSPMMVEIALPELAGEELERVARAIVEGRAEGEPPLVCGVAQYPECGTSAEELMDAGRAAAQQASRARPVVVAGESGTRPVVDRGSMVVGSEAMREVMDTVSRVARAAIPVLLVGETGTGKEVVARAIHDQSPRQDRPMRCVNCAAIPANLLESILFGHEKGSFTGATRRTDGVFREALGGTVFLDEIGELSAAAQAALLRVLETRRVTRVGAGDEDEVDVRVVAATHRNLESMCEAGSFRWDLLYRINTMTLRIPPLRQRTEEIEQLAGFFLREANEANGCQVQAVAPEALALMHGHHWPGNVRELRNVIHRAVVMTRSESLTLADMPEKLSALQPQAASPPRPGGPGPGLETISPAPGAGDLALDAGTDLDFKARVQQFEESLIRRALQQTAWNRTEAASLLKMPRRTLTFKLNAYGIDPGGSGK